MVQTKKFLIFAIATMVIASYALYEKGLSGAERKNPLSEYFSVTNWDFDNTKSISIKSNQSEILIIKEDDHWLMKKPLSDIASTSKTRTFIQELFITSLKKVDRGENAWSDYGFIDGKNILELRLKESHLHFHISPEPAFDGQIYVKVDNGLYLGSKSWIQIFKKSKSHFRDQTINRSWSDPVKVSVKSKKHGEYSLVKNEESWMLSEESATDISEKNSVVDSEKIQAVVNGLLFLTAKQAIEETQDKITDYGLDKPDFEFLLTDKVGKQQHIRFVVSGQKAFVATKDRSPIFEVLASTIERWDQPLSELKAESSEK